MRRIAVLAAMVAAVVAVPVLQRALADGDPRVAGSGCQPSPMNPHPYPARPDVQRIHCTYGPLTVSPGNNLILVGPVTVENPHAEGYITRFAPNLVDATTGQVPPIHVVHLHHGVWLNTTRGASDYVPFMATGEEKTVGELPAGYGYPTHPWDTWIANYMLHNLTPATFEVFLTYDLDFIPSGTSAYNQTKAVEPVWLDVVSHCGGSAAYPVYNPSNSGPDPVIADPTAPSGQSTVHTCTRKFSVNKEVELVWMGGHVHPGGVRDELHAESCSSNPAAVAGSPLLFNSRAVLNSQWKPSGYTSKFGSWDFSMTTTNTTSSPWRWHMNAGDQLSVKTVYDSGHPWYEAMGIMFGWAHVIAPGEQAETPACTVPTDTGGTPSGNIAENPTPVFGGSAPLFDPKQTYGQSGTATTSVGIYGFDYHPGGTGQAPVSVSRNQTVTFTNQDAYASIYHTVTSCGSFDLSAITPTTDACNLDYGQAYPLATWPSQGGFDTSQGVGVDASGTGELGWGLPGVTAAANYNTWSFHVPAGAAVGTVYPFYCRVHPSMRGSLKVVS